MSPPILSVVIVNWNTADILLDCLHSIAAQTRVAYDVWVVDNGSHDDSCERVRAVFPDVHLIANSDNRGFAAANNQALRLVQGDYILLLNSDTVVLNGALDAMVAFLHARPEIGAVGPRLLNADGSLQPSAHRFYSTWGSLVENQLVTRLVPWRFAHTPWLNLFDHSIARPVDWVCGAALMLRRQTLQRVGLLDEAFFMYAEEIDWQMRMRQADIPVWFIPHARIIHLGGGSSRSVAVKMNQMEWENRARLVAKHYPPSAQRIYRAKARLGRALWQAFARWTVTPARTVS